MSTLDNIVESNKLTEIITNQRPINSNKSFYVCSYGGCGSTMLTRHLRQFGQTYHVHSRNPPIKLTTAIRELFTKTEIDENRLSDQYVIYIYKNPINAIYSRFQIPIHLKHIETNESTTLQDVVTQKKDLYGIEEFFDNYTIKRDRNYKIICVKYEELFEKIEELHKILNIESVNIKYPVEKITKRLYEHEAELTEIYSNLIDKMNKMDFITIV
jgi:hypothetical protein